MLARKSHADHVVAVAFHAQDHHQLHTFTMDASGNCGVLAAELQSIVTGGHQTMATFRDGVLNLDDQGMSFRKKVSTFANERFAEGCVLFKSLWIDDENATEEKKLQLEYFKVWDNEMRSSKVWVDILWLTLAAKMLGTGLQIYSPRRNMLTKCIDPIKPIDVFSVLSPFANGPTLKVLRVTSAVSTSAHYNLLLDAEEGGSLHYTYGVSPAGESDDTRFIMSRKGDEVRPALETAMTAMMAVELDELDYF